MAEYWERMGISKTDYDELSKELESLMTEVARNFTRDTYSSEDAFFIAFMSVLSFTKIHFGQGYYLRFRSSKTAQTGKNAPEKIYGCDFGLHVVFNENSQDTFSKAIIGQAKNKPRRDVEGDPSEQKRLARQCKAMSNVTSNFVVTFRPDADGNIPYIYSGDRENKTYKTEAKRFDKYIVECILPCLHGETNKKIIEYMISSRHTGWAEYVKVFAIETNLPKPTPSPENAPDPSPDPEPEVSRSKPSMRRG